MRDFTFFNPVMIKFGKGAVDGVGDLCGGYRRVLVAFGGGSVKRNGILDRALRSIGGRAEVIEFGGIEPNPRYETLMKAAAICREREVDLILAVGGGSVLDGCKFIAAAARYKGRDPWDILEKGVEVESAIPIGAVITLAATGSEMNSFSVVSRESTRQKLAFASPHVFPKFSVLDPETLFTLPDRQVTNGIVDTFVHVTEQYLTNDVNSPLQDRQAAAILATIMEEGPKCRAPRKDYDAFANFMWCATSALNGIIGCGVTHDWATHGIGHEITAVHGLDHGQTLAIVHPALLRHEMALKKTKIAHMGRHVFHLTGNDDVVAREAVDRVEAFFRSVGAKTRLSEYGIDETTIANIAERAIASNGGNPLGENRRLGRREIESILRAAL